MDKATLIKKIIDLERRLSRALSQYTPEPWLGLNLTVAQLKCLVVIASEGSTSSRKLAEALGVTPANVTGIVDRLVEQGLVSRRENPDDRRMLIIELTEKGDNLLRNLWERGMNCLSEALSLIALDDLKALAQGLSALVKVVEKRAKGRRRKS